ncbi:MAG TPA: bifunctional [glutamate--ammonia ligase]-adenylyl-L-tyrosine phosphorylase/[glutamate--ammonia-ligase] adenylyltransferase [Candidatus Binataceae bacterium]|nr:bifunctional [glutamate--ammonia ligase]-adenylyl-L-tyrosine phosphorylase/[glutamate--ammonia-ligase] adenylyltransferase [Candidatus Binataceae bacterium]
MAEPIFGPALESLALQVARLLDDPALAAASLGRVRERAPDEELALAFMLRLGELSPPLLREALCDDARADDLIFCLGGSELIAGGLANSGANWVAVLDQARAAPAAAPPETVDDALGSVAELGAFKRRALLRIAITDLLGRHGVAATVAAMSQLADECVRAALALAAREVTGKALAQDFCVLAMGKLGAGELNLSSDIDLIYLIDGAHNLDRHAEAQRLGEKLNEILAAHCFRIDLRLRPGGAAAPLVTSIPGALNFYQTYGETWERAALLRARPVAGAVAAGQRFIAELSRFIYRVYLDFDTIRQLRAMKAQIEDELRSPELVRRNVKLGHGGIRELEFVVQALALIYGGRDPRLRTPGTIEALTRLEARGYMPASRAQELSAAYLFLRNVEHKLQVAAGLQTHTLPAAPRALAVLAARLGYGKAPNAADRFMRALDVRRALVADQFRAMFQPADGEHESPAAPALAKAAWRVALEPEWSIPALAELGFAHPQASARHLELLAREPKYLPASATRRGALERLGPRLLEELRELPDPDLALMNLASFIAAVGARTSFLALLEEHTATRRMLLRLFASSAYLSTLFLRHPEMIDTLVGSSLARGPRPPAALAAELRALLEACDSLESRLDALRTFRQQEFLRIAIADLEGELAFAEVQAGLTLLAETVLREALECARTDVAQRRAIPLELKLCVLALGRMGAGEMAYNSDLDLIFVYHLPGEVAAAGLEAASRVAQRLIAFLETPTREGFAYKIDVRLRPSGNAGPLVASFAGFHEYHRESSALWERQALVRGRVVAGDRALGEQVETARKQFVFGRGLDRAAVREIAGMRAQIERELGIETSSRLNLKQGPGGLVEVEFLAQMMALRYGQTHPAIRLRGTIELLHALAQNQLLDVTDARNLIDDYDFLSRLENRLRIESDQAATALPTAPERLTPIARRMGYGGAAAAGALRRDLGWRRARVRATSAAIFSREISK